MDSWDDDEFVVPTVVPEIEETSWNEEIDDAHKPAEASSVPVKPKAPKKNKLKELQERQEQEIERTKKMMQEMAMETPQEQKARIQKSMESADLNATMDTFGSDFVREPEKNESSKKGSENKRDIESDIGSMRLVTEADHERLGNLVAARLNARYTLTCMKTILTKGSLSLSAEDMKELTTVINVIKNEKIAATKPKGKKKKQNGKQGFTKVERANALLGLDDYEDTYEDLDDFDEFM